MKPLTAAVLISGALYGPLIVQATEAPLQYANHIFNAIHSSMRQFGSSLNHNGMSLFIATVPEGTEFYHGSDTPYRVNDTEWLAFEPEHAYFFARGFRGRKPPPEDVDNDDKPTWKRSLRFDRPPKRSEADDHQIKRHRKDDKKPWGLFGPQGAARLWNPFAAQNPIMNPDENEPRLSHGYLHTYRTKRGLRLLYVDGQSAAKSNKGTLDVQDFVLLHGNPPQQVTEDSSHDRKPRGPWGEPQRALSMCSMARHEWEGRIDGILRMEGGFEIILCDFERDLDVVRIEQAQDNESRSPESPELINELRSYYRAVAARYDGIGGNRVTLNYDDFVSLYTIEDGVYFDDTGRPRVDNDSSNAITDARTQIDDMVLRYQHPASTDWQAVTDMVVARYAGRIEHLASGKLDDLDAFKAEIDRAMRPFIDYSSRNRTTEIDRCAAQFLPHSLSGGTHENGASKAGAAIRSVSTMICRTLSAASIIDTPVHGLSMIRALKDWLAWTEWKKCPRCPFDEVCSLPIWPVGNAADFEQPQCVKDITERRDYWGGLGPPPF